MHHQFVVSILKQLGDKFSLKDMRLIHFFLKVEVVPTRDGLFMSQHKYFHDLLSNTNMSGAMNASTPLSTTQSLKLLNSTLFMGSSKFLWIFGSLQYLSLTCPDISFSTNKLLQFMHRLTQNHWTAVKRLFCYLKQTFIHDINKANNPILSIFSNAN